MVSFKGDGHALDVGSKSRLQLVLPSRFAHNTFLSVSWNEMHRQLDATGS